MSGFSFKGVYNAPIGTTRREASCGALSGLLPGEGKQGTDHARAGKRIPTESESIVILDLTPLIFEGVVVHA